MNAPLLDPHDRGPRLARDIALIVVVGAALGLAYNHSLLLANDDRALSWTVKPRATGVLDLAAPTAVPTAGTPAPATSATPATTPAVTPSATAPAPAHDSAAAAPAAKKAPPKKSTASTPASASKSPANGPIETTEGATKTATPAPATPTPANSAVPTIPDTREPLEASYAVIKPLHDANAALFVDARTAEEYAAGHIPGAVSLPFDDVFKKPDLAKQLDSQGRPIVTYCDGGDCELSKDLAFSLIDNGHKKVVFFKDGLPGWKSAGNAVHTGSQP